MSNVWKSYPKVYNIGHAGIRDIFEDPIHIEEKVDGSQFSFGIFDGQLRIRSKGKEQYPVCDKMFNRGVETVEALASRLRDGWMYSGEYLNKPKHNTICYERVPAQHIVIFDIRTGEEDYLSYAVKAIEAERLGLEVVPLLYAGVVQDVGFLKALLEKDSFLGGSKVEGVVAKNYQRFTRDGKAMLGKHVSEAFKERNDKDFRSRNPSKGDLTERLGQMYRSEARWEKAVQHLRDNGELLHEPKDIGPLIREVQRDLLEEEIEGIKEILFKHFWGPLQRRAVAGLPEWYKNKLLESAFGEGSEVD